MPARQSSAPMSSFLLADPADQRHGDQRHDEDLGRHQHHQPTGEAPGLVQSDDDAHRRQHEEHAGRELHFGAAIHMRDPSVYLLWFRYTDPTFENHIRWPWRDYGATSDSLQN